MTSENPTVALVAIVRDEEAVIGRWAAHVNEARDTFSEVVAVDGGSSDRTVERLRAAEIPVIVNPFADDFAHQRNFAIALTEADWIFELDADELMSAPLRDTLLKIVAVAVRSRIDCIGIPRLNFHNIAPAGADEEYVLQAGVGHGGVDYQYRLHHRSVAWRNRVHEETTGYTRRIELDIDDGCFLIHRKDAARHAARNRYYAQIAAGLAGGKPEDDPEGGV